MVLSREEAAKKAEKTTKNDLGMCQAVTRGYFNAPAAGDVDGDRAADAEDGWKAEPEWARHADRNPPRGAPVSFLGGSRDNGHRAISLGNGVIRSTDFSTRTRRFSARVVGNGSIAEVERAMGVKYVGWSETINGHKIPGFEKPAPKPEMTRGKNVDEAIRRVERAEKLEKDGTVRDGAIRNALKKLKSLKAWRKQK